MASPRAGKRTTMVAKDMSVSPFRAGLACRCPRCGEGKLFESIATLTVSERCGRCGLSFAFIDPGARPAVVAIMILGFVVLGAALLVEFRLAPPLWLHVALWTPVTLVLALGLLRPLKATLIALQYKYKAGADPAAED